ncbi:MAG TPA: IS1182 family transposase [Candidatus Dormibacteraeota bacterium]|nr:IS1182 family transposase [Candidatus Dormibacteraeota bacterium]
MRPRVWQPAEALSAVEQTIIRRIKRAKLFVFLRLWRHALFAPAFQAELATVYRDSPLGQPPIAPAQLALATILQVYTGVSDDEVIEATLMDRRWQLVLDCLDTETAPFSKGTLVGFRQRLIAHDLDRRLIERTVELAEQTDGFGPARARALRVALDSSPLWGAGRVEDTLNLLGHALRKALALVARQTARSLAAVATVAGAPVLGGTSLKAALDLDWTDPATRDRALGQVLGALEAVEGYLAGQSLGEAGPAIQASLATAHQVRVQDVVVVGSLQPPMAGATPPRAAGPRTRRSRLLVPPALLVGGVAAVAVAGSPSGHAVLREGVARDRRISIEDATMRHGRKSRTQRIDGYKRHVVRDLDRSLIRAVAITPANVPEAQATDALVADLARQRLPLGELHIDRAYLSSTLVRERPDDLTIFCKAWPVHPSGDRFAKTAFHLDWEQHTIRCPREVVLPFAPGGTVHFPAEVCATCPLRVRCTSSAHGRSVAIHPDERLLAELRERQETPAGRAQLRERVAVEHTLAHVGQWQGDRARYVGARKNLFDLRRTAVVENLHIIARAPAHPAIFAYPN